MGLYQLLNNLTASNYVRGLHVFSEFAPTEYDAWFSYTWSSLVKYIAKNGSWKLTKGNDVSTITTACSDLVLTFNGMSSKVPLATRTNKQFMENTTSKTREKVFSKWIKEIFSEDAEYLRLKKICSETAGANVCNLITTRFNADNVFDFFQIHLKEYYYAKTTISKTTILKVPSKKDFNSVIVFQGCRYEVSTSQLNIITSFKNIHTNKILEFRNECRFSHGQFNGTPEAKMYVVRDTPLFELYEPLD